MSCMPSIFSATAVASAAPPFTTFTPPPLPRPPAWIWALTTTTGIFVSVMRRSAMGPTSPTANAGSPFGTGTPYRAKICLA